MNKSDFMQYFKSIDDLNTDLSYCFCSEPLGLRIITLTNKFSYILAELTHNNEKYLPLCLLRLSKMQTLGHSMVDYLW